MGYKKYAAIVVRARYFVYFCETHDVIINLLNR